MTGKEIKAIGEAIDKELETSKMSKANKEAIKERIITKVMESGSKAIRGLETLTGNGRVEITLSNGMRINADALA